MKNQSLEPYSQYTELRLLRGNQEIQNKQCIFCGHHFPYFQGKLHLPYFSSAFYFRKYPKSPSQSFIKNKPMLLKVILEKKIYKYKYEWTTFLDILNLQKDSDALLWKPFLYKFEDAEDLQMGSLTHAGSKESEHFTIF